MNRKNNKPKTIPFDKVLSDFNKEFPGAKKRIEDKSDEYIAIMKLKELRKSLKISQQELSKRSGVSRDKISRIEKGQQNATLKTIYRLSSAMGKKVEISFN